ncbi:peptidylprolyl isomerase [uncultured Clostridium sp.]|uniref:peptidylprolyl isomerase n=1 Tax=uncultured Clostridium sp. TaxID=59620 RepID=UPI0025CC77B7|nr:peptidylprolyl isomerase [uncultured Clostridium sp.]
MKRIRKLIAVAALCTLSVSAMGCKMIEKTPEAVQRTVYATVGDEKITKADIDEEMSKQGLSDERLKEQYGDDYETKLKDQLKQVRLQTVNMLVNEKLLLQNAATVGVEPTEDELNEKVDEAVDQLKQQYTEEGQFEQELEASGFTEDSFREYQRKQIILQQVQDAILADIEITDDDAQTYYDENKDTQYVKGAGADAAHILIAEKDADGNIDFDASLAKANDVKAKLDAGADFAELASEYGTDGTKDKGGDLGFVEYNQANYDKDFLEGFKQLSEGQISDPVKSQFGYHIIKATGLKDEVVTPFEDVKEQIKSQLLQQKQSEVFNAKLEEWKEAAKVKTYEDRL